MRAANGREMGSIAEGHLGEDDFDSDAYAQRRAELRKHKTMKTFDELMEQNKMESCIPIRTATTRQEPSPTQPRNPRTSKSSASSPASPAFALLRDYEMATSVVDTRKRVELARQRSKVSFERQTIDLLKTFRTAPDGRSKIVLDTPPHSPRLNFQRPTRSSSSSALARSAMANDDTSSSSGRDDDSGSGSGQKKKKCVSFQVQDDLQRPSGRHGLHRDDNSRCDGNSENEQAHRMSPIHAACRKGDYLVVKHLLSFYVGQECTKLVNSACVCGMTPLQVACTQGSAKIVKLLLRRHARPNKRGSNTSAGVSSSSGRKRHRSCIAMACTRQSVEVVDLLIEYGANVDEDALITASGSGDVQIVRALMNAHKKRTGLSGINMLLGSSRGSDSGSSNTTKSSTSSSSTSTASSSSSTNPQASSSTGGGLEIGWIAGAATIAAANDHAMVLMVLLGDGRSTSSQERVQHCALDAANRADYKLLRALSKMFDHGLLTSVQDSNACNLLHLSVKQASAKCVMLLIRMGADVDSRDGCGITALYMACARGQTSIARLLVNAGATCTRMGPNDETPLHIAAQENHLACVEMLLEDGNASVDAPTKDRCTALHLASQRGNTQVAKCLLDHGANINARTVVNETPLIKASRMSNVDTVKLLLSRNADTSSGSQKTSSRPDTRPSVAATQSRPRQHEGEVESEESIHIRLSEQHPTAQRMPMDDRLSSSSGSSGLDRSRGSDSIFIAKSNTHTSFRKWLRSVVSNK